MKGLTLLLVLIAGMAAGVGAMIYGPQYVEPMLPRAMKAGTMELEGDVVAKRMRQENLLVTVNSAEGAILVTFTRKVDEIALLVMVGDKITLNLREYGPFVSDPEIRRVRKNATTGEPKADKISDSDKAVKPASSGKPPQPKDSPDSKAKKVDKAPISNTPANEGAGRDGGKQPAATPEPDSTNKSNPGDST